MGKRFSVLLLRKFRTNYRQTPRQLDRLMEYEGYTVQTDSIHAEVNLALYRMDGRRWQIITGDPAVLERYAEILAIKNRSEALLVTGTEDDRIRYALFDPLNREMAHARAGRVEDDSLAPAVDQAVWQAATHGRKKVDFKQLFTQSSLSSRDHFIKLGQYLDFDGAEILNVIGGGTEPDVSLHLSRGSDSFYITEGAPQMELAAYSNTPVIPEETCRLSFANHGGPGTGLQIMISGPFVETDALTFTEVTLEYEDRVYADSVMHKTRLVNGWYAYVYDFPSLELPPGIGRRLFTNEAYSLAKQKALWRLSAIPHGDSRYGLDVYFYVNPFAAEGMGFTHTNCGIDVHREWIEAYNRLSTEKLKAEDFDYDCKDVYEVI